MSPYHKFFCIKDIGTIHSDYDKYISIPSTLNIDDELLRYISDTLAWVPTTHLSKSGVKDAHNLNFYGLTTIDKRGAKILHDIVTSWHQLFTKAPYYFELTGSWVCSVDFVDGQEIEGEGYYEKLTFERNLITKTLAELISYARKVDEGTHIILHVGI